MKFKKLVEAKEDVKDQKDVLKKMNLDTAKEDEDKMVDEHKKNVDSFKKAMDECGKIVEGYHYTENKGNYVVNIKNRSSLAVLLENLKKQGIKNRISRSQVEGYRYDVSFKFNAKPLKESDNKDNGETWYVYLDSPTGVDLICSGSKEKCEQKKKEKDAKWEPGDMWHTRLTNKKEDDYYLWDSLKKESCCGGKDCKKEELLQEDPTQDRIEEIKAISKTRMLNDDEVRELAELSKKKNESCKRVSKRPIKESPQFDATDLAQEYWEEEVWGELDNFLMNYEGPINLSRSEKNTLCKVVAEKILVDCDELWDTIRETIQDEIYDTMQGYENDLDSGDFDESLKECGKGKKVDASEWAYTDTIEEAKKTKKPRARFNADPQASADFIAKGTSFNQNLAGQPCCESDEEDDEEEPKFDDEEGDIEIDGDIEVTDAPVEDEFNDGDVTDLDFVDIDDFDDVDLDSISVDDIVDEDETALDILKGKIDMHGELSKDGDKEIITIAEKGKLDDKKAPKLTIEANEEETEILAKEFATDEEEPTEDTDIEDEVDDDIDFDEIADGEKVDVKKELDNLKDVKVVGKEDTKEDTPVEDEVVEVEDDVDDTTLLDSLV